MAGEPRVLRQFENDCPVSPTAAHSEGGCVAENPPSSPFAKGGSAPAQGDFCTRIVLLEERSAK